MSEKESHILENDEKAVLSENGDISLLQGLATVPEANYALPNEANYQIAVGKKIVIKSGIAFNTVGMRGVD